jgi:hypothetical protein
VKLGVEELACGRGVWSSGELMRGSMVHRRQAIEPHFILRFSLSSASSSEAHTLDTPGA